MNILKIFTYAGCSQDYWDHIMSYPSNEDSVAVKGYGVDDSMIILSKTLEIYANRCYNIIDLLC